MSWSFILILAVVVVVVYISNVLGCLILCETIPEVEPARKFVWYVPILIVLFPISVMFDPAIKNKFRLIWSFIRTPHKSITAISSVVGALKDQEFKEEQHDPVQKEQSRQRRYSHILAGSVQHYGTAIFAAWLG